MGTSGVRFLPIFGGIDIDVDDFGVRREGGEAAGDAVVEAHAEGDQQVGIGHRHVGGVAAVHAGHADEVGMLGGQGAEAHQGADGGRVGELDELAQLGRGVGGDDAAARVDQRPLGFPDHLRGAADLAGVAFGEDLVAGQVDGGDRRVVALRLEDVLGDIDQHRAGTAAGGDVERLVDDLRQFVELLDQEVVLGAGARDAEGVGFLERVAADELAGDLAGDGDDRDGIHHGVHQAGGEVGGAGAGGGAADADLAGGARIAFGGEGGVLLVPHQHVADVVVVEGVVEGEGDAAGIAEDAIDAFPGQALQQHFRAAHQRRDIYVSPQKSR